MEYSHLVIVLVSLGFSALFSGIEIAFVSADKLHIELRKKQGIFTGRILSKFQKNPSQFIGTTLVGNTIALVVYGIFMANILEPLLLSKIPWLVENNAAKLLSETILSTAVVLITAEFTPKSVFLINPNGFLSFFSFPMIIIYYVMYPIVFIIVGLSKNVLTGIFRLEYSEEKPVFGLTDLNNYIEQNINQQEVKFQQPPEAARLDTRIFTNALEFKTVRVRECMMPRTEVDAVDIEDNISDLRETFIRSGHSKIIIYKDSIDEVIGYCHSLALFKKPKSISEILTPIIIVPETMPANELMIQFITEHKSLALVVDEFGGTAGIVSMEDLIEEIFGEIQDEHDDEDWIEKQIDEHNFMVSARHEIDYLNERFNWSLPSGEYDTLGGFILSLTEDIPETGNIIDYQNYRITILSKKDNRIDNVKVTLMDSNEA